MKRPPHHAPTGFSLVITLIILTLLSILVVSFISTSALERTTARAFASKAAAELAAQTATNQAMSLLTERITQFPDSATVWDSIALPGGSSNTDFEGTVLYYTEHQTDAEERNNPASARRLLPLVSRGVDSNGQLLGEVDVASKATALGTVAWTNDNSIDLNRPRSNTDAAGWIGSAPSKPGDPARTKPQPFRARWIDVKGQSGVTKDKTVARYAFWVEDESFKVNLNMLDNNLSNTTASGGRSSEILETKRLDTTKPLPPQLAGLVPIQGLLRSARASGDRDTLASKVKDLRDGWFGKQLFELRAFNQADTSSNLGDETKFLATIYSGGLNVSRHGTQRVNLNGLGFDKPLTAISPTDAEINKQLQQVIETIKFHAPRFGQRFYRASTATDAATLNAQSVTTARQTTYLHKIAANIRDYIDPDSQPTLITSSGTVAPRPATLDDAKALLAMSANPGTNVYWAQGKDGAPYLQEAVVRFRSSCNDATKRYNLKVDYYLEFWNMTDRDIYAKTQTDTSRRHLNDAFVKIADPVGWFGHEGGTPTLTADNSPTGNPSPGRDVIIDLSNAVFLGGSSANGGTAAPDGVVFKAGACTVITTDPDELLPFSSGSGPGSCYTTGGLKKANTYYCSVITGKREFAGPVPNQTGPVASRCDGIWPQFRDGATLQEDYGTEVILANAFGYIDSNPYTISKGGGPNVAYLSAGTPGSPQKTSRDDTYGGTLFGNGNSPSQLGDPRTNNEQLLFTRYKAGGTAEPDQTRYYNPTVSDLYRFSLGWPNSRYLFPYLKSGSGDQWRDYYKVWTKTNNNTPNDAPEVPNADADTAPVFVANENLKSIGQLGDIFDPARLPGNGTIDITGSRGGGRTFKIGQKDDLIDMSTATALSQQWASWRLTDFFGISSDLYQPGLININGLLRDNGAALRATCYGLTLKAVSQAATAAAPTVTVAATFNSEESATVGLQKLIDQATLRLKNNPATLPSYFRERGEISDLALYNAATNDLLSSAKMSESFDRTREELFRRLAELITTRGNVFTVYAAAQAITEASDGKTHVTGEHWVKTTFALLPKKADNTDFQIKQETWNPSDATARTQRFAKPDHYDIQLLQVSIP
jgi:hypothetical protein